MALETGSKKTKMVSEWMSVAHWCDRECQSENKNSESSVNTGWGTVMGDSTLNLQKVYLNCAVLKPSQLLQNYVPFPDKAQKKKV